MMNVCETIAYAIRKECSKYSLIEWCEEWGFTIEQFEKFLDAGVDGFSTGGRVMDRKTENQLDIDLTESGDCGKCNGLDLIRRQDAIDIASGYCHPANIAKELMKLPSAEKTGKWIYGTYTSGEDYRRCTNCFVEIEESFFGFEYAVNYCPHCGAKMEGVEDEAD